ncbi:MAG: hypothetical protein IJJ43_04890, partial [Oscillospiraceae bacterium]|nr:hypothetical protein [Oscillospiraceae bacterium]
MQRGERGLVRQQSERRAVVGVLPADEGAEPRQEDRGVPGQQRGERALVRSEERNAARSNRARRAKAVGMNDLFISTVFVFPGSISFNCRIWYSFSVLNALRERRGLKGGKNRYMGYKHSKRKDGRYKVVFHGKQFYGKTLAEARAKRDKFVRLVEEGLQTTQETVAEYAPKWLERTKIGIKPHTYNGYAKMLDDMNEVIGNLYLDEVKPQHIKTVYAKKFAGRSGSHIRHAKNLYTGMFEAALEDGYIRFNPCRSKSAQPHKGVDGTHREITDEERYYIETTEHRL